MNEIFNRKKLKLARDRASFEYDNYNYLFSESSKIILERLNLIETKPSNILELGARDGNISKNLIEKYYKDSNYTLVELSEKLISKSKFKNKLIGCEEYIIKKLNNKYDLIISSLNLHFYNNPALFLKNIKNILNDNSYIILTFFGGKSLANLRNYLITQELAKYNHNYSHIIPMIQIYKFVEICNKIGFKKIIVEQENITASYKNQYKLMDDLRMMGESNCMNNMNYILRKDILIDSKKNNLEFIDKFEIIIALLML